jgi:integrase
VAQRPDPGVTRYQTSTGEARWRVTYDLPPGPDGERRRTTKRGFATVKDANRFRRDALARHEQGLGRDPAQGRQRLGDYLRAWLDGLSVKPTSRADYRQSIECYIAPRIGGIRLEQLTPEHLDRLYRGLEANGKRRGPCRTDGRSCQVDGCTPDLHEGLSAKSVRNVHGFLHVALEAAVARGYLPRNVADLANPPKARRARSRNARDHCWTRDQLVTFLDHTRASGDRHHALWFLIATTGLRRAEALALRWTDVDLDRARLTIRQTVTVANGVIVWQRDAKSDDSERTIALDTRTVAVLNDHRRRQLEQRLAAGPGWTTHPQDHDLVFTRADGTAIPPKRASQLFTRHVDAAGLPRIGVHGLRHSWATLALRAGVPIKVVSERIGHADPAVTMQVYAHALEGDDATAAETTATAIFGDQ